MNVNSNQDTSPILMKTHHNFPTDFRTNTLGKAEQVREKILDEANAHKTTIGTVVSIISLIILMVFLVFVVPLLFDSKSSVGAAINSLNNDDSGIIHFLGEGGTRLLLFLASIFVSASMFSLAYTIYNKGIDSLIVAGLTIVAAVGMLVAVIGRFAKSSRTVLVSCTIAMLATMVSSLFGLIGLVRGQDKSVSTSMTWMWGAYYVISAVLMALVSWIFIACYRRLPSGAHISADSEKRNIKFSTGATGTQKVYDKSSLPNGGDSAIASSAKGLIIAVDQTSGAVASGLAGGKIYSDGRSLAFPGTHTGTVVGGTYLRSNNTGYLRFARAPTTQNQSETGNYIEVVFTAAGDITEVREILGGIAYTLSDDSAVTLYVPNLILTTANPPAASTNAATSSGE